MLLIWTKSTRGWESYRDPTGHKVSGLRSSTRNLLLPRLISGKVDVWDIADYARWVRRYLLPGVW